MSETRGSKLHKNLKRIAGWGAAVPFMVAFGALTGAWPIMIALGILHHEVHQAIPPLGFWPVMGISWGLGALLTKFKKYQLPRESK